MGSERVLGFAEGFQIGWEHCLRDIINKSKKELELSVKARADSTNVQDASP